MSKRTKDLNRRARAAGLDWDGKARLWIGAVDYDDGAMEFTLTAAQLPAYLDPPALPAGVEALPLLVAPSDTRSASRPDGAGHHEGSAA